MANSAAAMETKYSLGSVSVSAVKWSTALTLGRFLLQLAAQVVLARLLGPDSYGLFGLGMIVYTFGAFFSSACFARNLMQQPEISAADIRFVFTWQLIAGGLASLCIYLAAPALSIYFKEPRVESVIEWLSLACLISSATATSANLIQRNLAFKAYGVVQMLSYALGYLVVGIPLALNGAGVYSLVAAWLVQLISLMLACYWLQPHSLKPLLWFGGARQTFSFGSTVFLTNIVNWLLNNVDRIVIGRVINAHAVGLYTAGYNLATMPNTLLIGPLQSVLLAAGAKLQAERARLATAYRQIFATIWVLLLPVFVFLAAMAPSIVALLYGERWSGTAPVLAILFLATPAFIAWGLSTPILWHTERKHQEAGLQLPILLIGIGALFAVAGNGIHVVAITTAAIVAARGVCMCVAAFRALEIPLQTALPPMLRGALLSLPAAIAAWLGISMTHGHPLLALIVSSVFATALLAGIVLIRPHWLGTDTRDMLVRFVPALRTNATSMQERTA